MRYVFLAAFVFSLIFWQYPDLDLAVTLHFYREGEGFIYGQIWLVKLVYVAVRVMSVIIFFGLLTICAVRFFHARIPQLSGVKIPSYRATLFLFLALVLGPGIIIHQGIKEIWGRPRPDQVSQFGGPSVYVPPMQINHQDGKSFVSGHASMGFYLAAFAFLYRGRKRIAIYATGIVTGLLFGFMRIIQGDHFLSDVIFSGVVVLLTTHVLYYVMFKRPGLHDEKIR